MYSKNIFSSIQIFFKLILPGGGGLGAAGGCVAAVAGVHAALAAAQHHVDPGAGRRHHVPPRHRPRHTRHREGDAEGGEDPPDRDHPQHAPHRGRHPPPLRHSDLHRDEENKPDQDSVQGPGDCLHFLRGLECQFNKK